MDLFEQIEKTRHFGETFLIWLWFHSDVDDTQFELAGGQVVSVTFDNELTLEAKLAEAERTRISGGAPASSEEARQGLRQGKVVVSAKLKVEKDQREWIFLLNAQTMDITGLRIPALLTKAEDEKLYERQFLIEEIDGLVRGLYDSFLRVRLDKKAWESETRLISAWINSSPN